MLGIECRKNSQRGPRPHGACGLVGAKQKLRLTDSSLSFGTRKWRAIGEWRIEELHTYLNKKVFYHEKTGNRLNSNTTHCKVLLQFSSVSGSPLQQQACAFQAGRAAVFPLCLLSGTKGSLGLRPAWVSLPGTTLPAEYGCETCVGFGWTEQWGETSQGFFSRRNLWIVTGATKLFKSLVS